MQTGRMRICTTTITYRRIHQRTHGIEHPAGIDSPILHVANRPKRAQEARARATRVLVVDDERQEHREALAPHAGAHAISVEGALRDEVELCRDALDLSVAD